MEWTHRTTPVWEDSTLCHNCGSLGPDAMSEAKATTAVHRAAIMNNPPEGRL